jgi:hypothetical protein
VVGGFVASSAVCWHSIVRADIMADAPAAPINITVRDQNQGELHFKLKPSTKMAKIFDAYCQKKGLAVNTLKYVRCNPRRCAPATKPLSQVHL